MMQTERIYVVHETDPELNRNAYEVDLEGSIAKDILLTANIVIAMAKEYDEDIEVICGAITYAALRMNEHIENLIRTEVDTTGM